MKEKDISAASAALKKELTDSILKKLDSIRENVVLDINEELDDVLLNWEYSPINSRLSFQDQYDLEDEDDDF
jgi:hypothetical protein